MQTFQVVGDYASSNHIAAAAGPVAELGAVVEPDVELVAGLVAGLVGRLLAHMDWVCIVHQDVGRLERRKTGMKNLASCQYQIEIDYDSGGQNLVLVRSLDGWP